MAWRYRHAVIWSLPKGKNPNLFRFQQETGVDELKPGNLRLIVGRRTFSKTLGAVQQLCADCVREPLLLVLDSASVRGGER